jgi:metal-responsive CopG/Arc/MetJ family transcriptional regulator
VTLDDDERGSSMQLFSFRLPPELIEQIDRLAERDRKRRADLIREALTRYVADRTAPVAHDEAERALETLRRLLPPRTPPPPPPPRAR